VLAAAGVDRDGVHAEFSVEGSQVALAAPAVDIVTTDLRNAGRTGYATTSGTSDATAIIAGAAALVRARFPEMSAPEVIHRLTATADDKGLPGRDHQYGYGVLNIVRALTEDVPPLATTEPPTTVGAPPGRGSSGLDRIVVVLGALGVLAAVGVALALASRHRRPSRRPSRRPTGRS
jgi:subtilisin family serine protease